MCFFFNDTATTEIYTLSLHDALPILGNIVVGILGGILGGFIAQQMGFDRVTGFIAAVVVAFLGAVVVRFALERSEEHTSELQSRQYIVCRLLLENKQALLSFILIIIA